MRIIIKYESSMAPHLIELNMDELNQLKNADEVLIWQTIPAQKSLHISGSADELELLAEALLNRAKEIRQ